MRRFHRPIPLVSSLLLCSACVFAADPPLRFDPVVEARLDAALRERMAAQRLPGIAVLISVSGQGEYRRAFGEANLRLGENSFVYSHCPFPTHSQECPIRSLYRASARILPSCWRACPRS